MSDDTQLINQLIDQAQNLSHKIDTLNQTVQKLSEEQNQFTHVLAGFFSITTSIEAATAFAVTLSAIALYLTVKWRHQQPEPKTQPLPPPPTPARVPKPKPKPAISEQDVEELLKYAPRTKDKPVDTLAALAQELRNGR